MSGEGIEIDRQKFAKKVFAMHCDTIEAVALDLFSLITEARSLEPQGTLSKWNRIDSMAQAVDLMIAARRKIVDSTNTI